MLRASALPWSSSAAARPARGQLGTPLPPPVRSRAVRRRAHSSAAPAPVLADAGASTSSDFVAAGFGARGVGVCEQLLATRALPPLACWPLPGDTPAANAAAFKARACGSCVLIGSPADASAPATVQLAQMLSEAGDTSVCAVLASPFGAYALLVIVTRLRFANRAIHSATRQRSRGHARRLLRPTW